MITSNKFFNSFIPAILWWLFVLVLMCTPGNDLPDLGSWTELISLDKLLHFIFFGMMGYFFMRPLTKKGLPVDIQLAYFLKIAIAICIWGLTTEFIQYFWIEGRTFDLWDFIADSAGSFAGYFYCKKYFLK